MFRLDSVHLLSQTVSSTNFRNEGGKHCRASQCLLQESSSLSDLEQKKSQEDTPFGKVERLLQNVQSISPDNI